MSQRVALLAIAGALGLAPSACQQINMHNTGLKGLPRSEQLLFEHVEAAAPPEEGDRSAERRSGPGPYSRVVPAGPAAGFSDKVADEAAQILARLADGWLQTVEEDYEYTFEGHVLRSGRICPDGRASKLVLRRVVRFPAREWNDAIVAAGPDDESDFAQEWLSLFDRSAVRPRVSSDVFAFVAGLIENAELTSAQWNAGEAGHYFPNGDRTEPKWVQFATQEYALFFEPGAGHEIRLDRAELRIFCSHAYLPNLQEIKDLVEQEGHSDWIAALGRHASSALDDLSLKVALRVEVQWNEPGSSVAHVRELKLAAKNVWPIRTHVASGVLEVDPVVLRSPLQEWIPDRGENYTLRVRVLETSDVVDWIRRARERLARFAE